MNLDSMNKPRFDMVNWSGLREFKNNLKYEGSDIEINFEPSQLIDGVNTPIRAIIRRSGVDDKENLEKRKIIIGKEFTIKKGDYITYNDDIYMIYVAIDKDNPFHFDSEMKLMDHTVNWKNLGKPIPCWGTKSSYGEKGLVATAEYDPDFDSRLALEMQLNEVTKKIYAGMRFCFNSSKNSIYEVTFVNHFDPNILNLTLRVSKFIDEDDLENNICFNPVLEKPEDPTQVIYTIENSDGDFEINVGSTSKFYLDPIPVSGEIAWKLEEGTNLEIVNSHDNYVEVKGLTKKKYDVLKCYVDGELIATRTLYVVNLL